MQKVTKEQADLIQKVIERYNGDKTKAAMNFVPSKGLTQEIFTRCMIEGYQITKPKEVMLRELYESYHRQGVARTVIRKVLTILEVEVGGISDDKN